MNFDLYSSTQPICSQLQSSSSLNNDVFDSFNFFSDHTSINQNQNLFLHVSNEFQTGSKYQYWTPQYDENINQKCSIVNIQIEDNNLEINAQNINVYDIQKQSLRKQEQRDIIQNDQIGLKTQKILESDRKNNYITKIIFTQFKKLLNTQANGYKQFFKFRSYQKNHAKLADFEKIFSFVQNFQSKCNQNLTVQQNLDKFKIFINNNMQILLSRAVKYEKQNKIKQANEYRFYLDLILQALNKGQNYIDRLNILYRGNKYKAFLNEIQNFIDQIITFNNVEI